MEPDTRTKKAMGAYIWGDVGSGKTMLMDLLYENAPAARKRRVHFHQFMIEAHARIHARNMEMLADKSLTGDAVLHVAAQIADEAHLLCFDELQITDICDAFIVSKMLAALWQRGTILIATSNRPPNDLYKDGLNRAYFVPFLRRLEKECAVLPILSGRDFRQDAVHVPGTYYAPASAANREQLWKRFVSESAANAAPEANTRVPVFLGRTLEVPFAAVVRSAHAPSSAATSMSTLSEVRACFADFRSLCDLELGAADYKGLAAHFKIVYVHGIPVMSVLKHDRARRFITLVDELYDAGVLLRWTADEAPARLFRSVSAAELIAEAIKQNDGSGGGGIGSFAPGLLGTDHAWNSPGGRLDERHVDNEKVNEVVEAVKRGGNGHVQPIALGTDHKWDDYGARLDERHVKNFMEIKDDPNRTSAAELPAAVPASKFAAPRSIDAAQEELKLLEGELASVQELRFAFKRAASRLTEMSGEQYLAAWQRRHGGGAAAVEAASPRPL